MSWFGLGPASQPKKVKACALMGLHMMAEENTWRSDSGSSVSSGRQRGIRRHSRPLPSGGKGGFELPHSPGHVVPGNA